jgi:HEAT repeat protein
MTSKDKLVEALILGANDKASAVRAAALKGIGESGLIDESQLVTKLLERARDGNTEERAAAMEAMGRMLQLTGLS